MFWFLYFTLNIGAEKIRKILVSATSLSADPTIVWLVILVIKSTDRFTIMQFGKSLQRNIPTKMFPLKKITAKMNIAD